MKRIFLLGLVLASMVCGVALAETEAVWAREGVALMWGRSDTFLTEDELELHRAAGAVPEWAEALGYEGIDGGAVFQLDVRDELPLMFLAPQGAGEIPNYHYKYLRVTMAEEPTQLYTEEQWVVNLPETVEVLGDVYYGRILEIGEDYVEVEPAYDDLDFLEGSARFAFTDETDVDAASLDVGKTNFIVHDADGVVLLVMEANG